MGAFPNVHSKMFRAPNLLIPGKTPVGNVRIGWGHPLTQGLKFCIGPAGTRDLVTGQEVTVNGACAYTQGIGWYFPGATTAYLSNCGDWDQQSGNFSVIALITPEVLNTVPVIVARGDSSANEWLFDIRNAAGDATYPRDPRVYADQGDVSAVNYDDAVQADTKSVVGFTMGYNAGAGCKTFYAGNVSGTDTTGDFSTISSKSITIGGTDEVSARVYKGWIHTLLAYDYSIPDHFHSETARDFFQFLISA